MQITHFVCDRCGTDEAGKKFNQLEMRGTHATQTLHLCEKCFDVIALEIPEINRLVGKNVKENKK